MTIYGVQSNKKIHNATVKFATIKFMPSTDVKSLLTSCTAILETLSEAILATYSSNCCQTSIYRIKLKPTTALKQQHSYVRMAKQ